MCKYYLKFPGQLPFINFCKPKLKEGFLKIVVYLTFPYLTKFLTKSYMCIFKKTRNILSCTSNLCLIYDTET